MTIEETIQKAMDGGYTGEKLYLEAMLLKPSFWQSLGKAMGWKDESIIPKGTTPQWVAEWHYFIDHLSEGKTIEEFFNQF